MSVVVRKVETPQDYKPFFRFPWQLYKDDPNWVPPLLSMRDELLNKKKNPSWEYLEGDYYTAWRGDNIVGTIAAYVNHYHNEIHNENIAWFGFFECKNDTEAANALFDTAEQWAKDHGYDAVRGPQSFTFKDEAGLLVDGFTRPVLLMPYNPPYYADLVESAGYKGIMDAYSMYGNWDTAEQKAIVERVTKLADFAKKRGRISVRPINRRELQAEFELFRQIVNDAWDQNWGFTPVTKPEVKALADSLGMIFDPNLACFGYVDDEPAGFVLSVPDFGQVLQKAQPRPGIPEPISLLRAAWHWKIRPVIDWLRVPLMGVVQKHHQTGVDLAMYSYILQQFAEHKQYKHLDVGWILESNLPMMNLALKSMGMKIYKTYRFYEKSVTPQA